MSPDPPSALCTVTLADYYPNTLAAPALSVPSTLADRMLVNYDSNELGKAIIIGVGQVCFFSDLTSGLNVPAPIIL